MKRLEKVLGIGLGLAIAFSVTAPANAKKIANSGQINTQDAQLLDLVDPYLYDNQNPLFQLSASQKIADAHRVCRSLDSGLDVTEWVTQVTQDVNGAIATNQMSVAEGRAVLAYWGAVGAAGITVYCPQYQADLEDFLAQNEQTASRGSK